MIPREVARILDHPDPALVTAIGRAVAARLDGERAAQERAERDAAHVLAPALVLSDLHGRAGVVLAARRLNGGSFASAPGRLDVEAGIDVLLSRFTELASGYREAASVYLGGGFALARAATLEGVQKVRAEIVASMRRGESEAHATARIARVLRRDDPDRWDEQGAAALRAYARVVWRTNATSAFTAGRFRVLRRDADIRRVVSGFRFVAVHDEATRDNHRAADGLVASASDPVWSKIAPPLGYNCRCSVLPVATSEMSRRGLTFSDGRPKRNVRLPPLAGPDRGFVKLGRPDEQFFGA